MSSFIYHRDQKLEEEPAVLMSQQGNPLMIDQNQLKTLIHHHRAYSKDKGALFRSFMKQKSQERVPSPEKVQVISFSKPKSKLKTEEDVIGYSQKKLRSTSMNQNQYVPPSKLDKYLDNPKNINTVSQYLKYDINSGSLLNSNQQKNQSKKFIKSFKTIDQSTTKLHDYNDYDNNNNNPDEYNTSVTKPHQQYIRTQPNEPYSRHLRSESQLNNHENWASQGDLSYLDSSKRNPSLPGQPVQKISRNQYLKKQQSSIKNDSVFVGTDRFLPQKNRSLSQYGMTNINPMLSDTVAQDKTETLERGRKFLLENLYFPNLPTFNQNKLNEFHQQDEGLQSPRQRRSELEEIKEQFNQYQKFKEQLKQKNHANLILKGSYQSGVMRFDSPERDDTIMYKKEQNENNRVANVIEYQIGQRFEKNMPFLVTNPNIIPINSGLSVLKERKQSEFPSQVHVIDPLWKKQKRVGEGIHNFNTHQKVLGEQYSDLQNYYNEDRASYLQSQDTNNKDYNIITGVVRNQPI